MSVPSSELGPPHPLSRKRMCTPTPEPKGGTVACGWGDGGVQIRTTGEKALSTLQYAYNGGREKSSGQAHLFNIWTTGATDRTSGQPLVELSLLQAISYKTGPLESKTKNWPEQQSLLSGIQLLETKKTEMCTLQGKSHLCIPFLGIARPQSLPIDVSVSDLYIPMILPHISLQQNWQTDPGNI